MDPKSLNFFSGFVIYNYKYKRTKNTMTMTNTMFIQLIDAMNEVAIDVTTIDAAKKTFDRLLKVIRRDHGFNYEKEMAAVGISSCITFRTWLNDEATHAELRKYAQGRKVLAKYEKSVEKFNLAMSSMA